MDNSGQSIIQSLRRQVQDDAQRKSEKLKAKLLENTHLKEEQHRESNQNVKSTNIFANMKKPQSVNLFKGQRKSVNLFQIKSQQNFMQNSAPQNTKNIFNVQQKPTIETKQEGSEDQKSGQGQGQNQIIHSQHSQNVFKSQPDVKIMKYQYKNQMHKILQLPIRKFKNGQCAPRQQIYLSLQALPNQPSTLYLLIRTNATKLMIYQGAILKNVSKLQHFMSKLDNIKFDVVRKGMMMTSMINKSDQIDSNQTNHSKGQNQGNKVMKELVKIQFINQQQCKQFQKTVNQYFANGIINKPSQQ